MSNASRMARRRANKPMPGQARAAIEARRRVAIAPDFATHAPAMRETNRVLLANYTAGYRLGVDLGGRDDVSRTVEIDADAALADIELTKNPWR